MLETVKTRLHQAREWLMDYAYLVTLGAMIAVIAGTALYTDHLRSHQNVQAAAPAPEISSSPTPQISPIPVPTLAPIRMAVRGRFRFAPSPADRFAASPLSPYSGRVLTAGSRIPLWTWPPKRAKPPSACATAWYSPVSATSFGAGASKSGRRMKASAPMRGFPACLCRRGRPSHAVRRSAMCWRAFRRKASLARICTFRLRATGNGSIPLQPCPKLSFLRFAEKGTSEIHPIMVY